MGLYKATKISRTPGKASKDLESKQQQLCAALFPPLVFPKASKCIFFRSAYVTTSKLNHVFSLSAVSHIFMLK